MSDSIRTDEIEKFLSSVRGFVSSQPTTPQRRRVKSELLVLTPANRVDDDADDTDATETPMEYSRVTPEPMSNVLHLDTVKQQERESLEATIAELEAAVAEPSEDWETDTGESSENDPSSVNASQAPADDSLDGDIGQGADAAVDMSEAEAEAAATPDPQNPGDGALKSPDMASQIAQEVAKAFGVHEVARNIMNDMEDDTLRAMVTEIIREELSGELGEKITRNVRKLVRREINRAFMARGID